jgi:hypothetical protein
MLRAPTLDLWSNGPLFHRKHTHTKCSAMMHVCFLVTTRNERTHTHSNTGTTTTACTDGGQRASLACVPTKERYWHARFTSCKSQPVYCPSKALLSWTFSLVLYVLFGQSIRVPLSQASSRVALSSYGTRRWLTCMQCDECVVSVMNAWACLVAALPA